jgi:hypothetical protein
VFPGVRPDEMRTIGKIVFPGIRERLVEVQGTGEALLPFGNGGPGLTNGVAALKFQLAPKGVLLDPSENGYVSIPDLHGRLLARSKPGVLNFATAGPGTNPHIAAELINHLGKVDIVAIH